MNNFRQSLVKTPLWEHLVPFLLVWILANGYLWAKSPSIWATLQESGLGTFNADILILTAFILLNICCFLGYALSQLCLYTIRVLMVLGQDGEHGHPPAAARNQLSSQIS